jgi:hypothetical protein
MTWHPGRSVDTAQTVEVRFTAEGAGTRVDLTHSGWETLGKEALETWKGDDTGWDIVLGKSFAEVANSR